MQEAIKQAFGVTADLKAGHSGVFDVTIDEELVYSKHDTYRFPTNEEVFAKVREHQKT